MAYKKIMGEKVYLVHKAVRLEMRELESAKTKNYSLAELKKTYRIKSCPH